MRQGMLTRYGNDSLMIRAHVQSWRRFYGKPPLKARSRSIGAGCDFDYASELLARLCGAYAALDQRTREAARRAYYLFSENPAHPSLRFKKLGGFPDVWSVRITEQYRAIGERQGDKIAWAWIDSHNDFDKLFG